MIRAALFLPLVLAVPAVAAIQLDDPKPERSVDVEVAGRSFKVEIAGRDVRVTDRSLHRITLAERDAMREAAEKATGCKLTDELFPQDGRLRGRAECLSASAR